MQHYVTWQDALHIRMTSVNKLSPIMKIGSCLEGASQISHDETWNRGAMAEDQEILGMKVPVDEIERVNVGQARSHLRKW